MFLQVLDSHGQISYDIALVSIGRDSGTIMATVAGMNCEFLIDSGAQVNTLSEECFKQLCGEGDYRNGLHNIQQGTDRALKAYSTEDEIPVLGTFEAFLFISQDRPVLLEKFYIVRESQSLLGRPTATRYSVLLLGLQVPITSQGTADLEAHPEVRLAAVALVDVFPKFNIPPVEIKYDTTKPPCRIIFFNIPLAVKPLVERRLQQLEASNIIERVEDGMDVSFCSSMLVVPKGIIIIIIIQTRGLS